MLSALILPRLILYPSALSSALLRTLGTRVPLAPPPLELLRSAPSLLSLVHFEALTELCSVEIDVDGGTTPQALLRRLPYHPFEARWWITWSYRRIGGSRMAGDDDR